MGITIKYRSDRRRIILFLSFLCLVSLSKAQTTFDINDPRNPNCPCHKYQKIADEEYKKLLRNGNKGVGEFAGKWNSREDKIRRSRIEKYKRSKHKKRSKAHRQPRWLYEFKHWDIWKRVTDPINCPIWKG